MCRRPAVQVLTRSRDRRGTRAAVAVDLIVNGDWEVHGRVQHFCPPGCCNGREDTVDKLTTRVSPALAGVDFKLPARNRC